jgi:hypothetical protein
MMYREPTREEIAAIEAKDPTVAALIGAVVYQIQGGEYGDVRISLDGKLAYSGACEESGWKTIADEDIAKRGEVATNTKRVSDTYEDKQGSIEGEEVVVGGGR